MFTTYAEPPAGGFFVRVVLSDCLKPLPHIVKCMGDGVSHRLQYAA